MKHWIVSIVFGLSALPGLAQAAGGGAPMKSMEVDLSQEALRDGAETFVDNCLGCHSAKYFRYKNLQTDLGMSRSFVEDELMYGMVNVNDKMRSAMEAEAGGDWLGAEPPDLSLTARVRGTDWIYSYLLSFYQDDTHTGWNNEVFPQASMPNVLVHMTDGAHEYYTEDVAKAHAHAHSEEGGHFEFPEAPEELDKKVQNLVSFMSYMADPSVLKRQSMGPWVLLFIVVLGIVTFLVKKEYWRDIH